MLRQISGLRNFSLTTGATTSITDKDGILTERLVGFSFSFAGAPTVTNISRLRIIGRKGTLIDLGLSSLRAYLNSFTRGRYLPATTDARLSVPLYFPDMDKGAARYTSQFDSASGLQIDFVMGTFTAGTGDGVRVSTLHAVDVAPTFRPRIVDETVTITATGANQRFAQSSQGPVRGVLVPAGSTFDRIQLVNENIFPNALIDGSGAQLVGAMIQEGLSTSLVDPLFYNLDVDGDLAGIAPYTKDKSGVVFDTTGAATSQTIGLYSIEPNP